MLEEGRGDPVFIAHALARYAGQVPEVEPLVRGLAANFNREKRTYVLSRLEQARSQGPANQPAEARHWPPAGEPQPDVREVRVDPELGRVALGLNLTAPLRVWLVLRQHFGQPGWTDRQTLYAALQGAGVTLSRRHFNRLLKEGEGLFWGLTGNGRVHARGIIRVVKEITARALAENPDLVATNTPGVRDVYLRVDGPLTAFKARLYAGWLTHRENPRIARATLCKLFACTRETLWAWEALLPRTLEVIPSYTQIALDPRDDERLAGCIPAHAYNYLTRHNQVRIRWQSPNVYRTRLLRQHPRNGQSRKARVAAAKVIRDSRPAEKSAGGRPDNRRLAFGRDHWEPRQYFASAACFRAFVRRQGARAQAAPLDGQRSVFRGYDRREHAIYELALDDELLTGAWERISVRKEAVWRRAEDRHRAGWMQARGGAIAG